MLHRFPVAWASEHLYIWCLFKAKADVQITHQVLGGSSGDAMGLKRGLRGVCGYLYLQQCTLYMLVLSQNWIFNHHAYFRVYLYGYVYIRCIYTLDLWFLMYLTTNLKRAGSAGGVIAKALGTGRMLSRLSTASYGDRMIPSGHAFMRDVWQVWWVDCELS